LSAGDANSTFGRTTSLLLGLLTRPALAHAIMAKPTAAAAKAKRRCFRMEASQCSSVMLLRHPANVCDGHHEMSLFAQPHAFWQRLSKPARAPDAPVGEPDASCRAEKAAQQGGQGSVQ
jgi:hypothetical protein